MHVKHHIRFPSEPLLKQQSMAIPTLLDYASDKMLIHLLVKERAKCRRRNRCETHHHLDKDCDLSELTTRKKLSRLMPPRYNWVRPSKREKLANGALDTSKNAEKALLLTISRDKKLQKQGHTFDYLDEQQAFFSKIRSRLSTGSLTFESPRLLPILKDTEKQADGTLIVTCRPLSVYAQLEDKILLALTSRYLTRYFDCFLHENILSYRHARDFYNQKHHVTNFNDGIRLIAAFRDAHASETIYAADCDIKKFYDIIPHQVVLDCFRRMLSHSSLSGDGKEQVMRVLSAYLASYNFYTNALLESRQNDDVFSKIRRRLHDSDKKNTYQLGWVDELLTEAPEQLRAVGVPQGGALSLQIANIVLNDTDQALASAKDPNRLFIRYCDDMILLHTDYSECCRLMDAYTDSLTAHGLYYHPFKSVSDCSTQEFWHIKSHRPFLWADGDGNSNRYIGFLGYEIRRDGRMRLRKSNIQRFEEKISRLRFVLHRYRKKHSDADYQAHRDKMIETLLNGIQFYEAFDLDSFKLRRQYQHIKNLAQRLL
jgi:hypothetical protein